MATRIQRKRTKGWKMPEGAVYVGRPTRWGNPFIPYAASLAPFPIVAEFTAEDAAKRYAEAIAANAEGRWVSGGSLCPSPADIAILQGKDLACWCPLDAPCHADVLLKWANQRVAATEGKEQ